jgi:hypothetical protein
MIKLTVFVSDKAAASEKTEAYYKYVEVLSEARTQYAAKNGSLK